MILGSHNSITYLPPKRWKIFNFMAKCQESSIQEQYEQYNVRLFDIRIHFNKLEPEIKHGLITYDGSLQDILEYLNSRHDKVYVRVILETCRHNESQELLFINECKLMEKLYPNIYFFGGNRKYDWFQLYNFHNPDLNIVQKVSSMTKIKLTGL